MRGRRAAQSLIGLVALLGLSPEARGLEVSVVEAPTVVFQDEPAQVVVELSDLSEDVTSLKLEADPKLTVRGPQRDPTTRIVNGVRLYRFLWELTPPGRGRFALGPVRVKTASGKEHVRELSAFTVVRRAPKGRQRLVIKAPARAPVGFPVRVTYAILTSAPRVESGGGMFDLGRQQTHGLTALGLTVRESGAKIVPVETPGRGRASELGVARDLTLFVHSGIEEHEGLGYHALTFSLQVVPRKPGPIDLAASAKLKVVGGVRRQRDFFGRVVERRVAKEVEVTSPATTLRVDELPREGCPKGFTGAVGVFTIEAEPARQTANAFDPITVKIRIRGQGLLEDVRLPAWHEMPELQRSFQIATDEDPGKVEGDTKTFTKVFRATSAAVTELPSLPFPFYDAEQRAYRVARSAPVPLEIREVKTVRADEAIGGGNGARTSDTTPTIQGRDGVRANYLSLGDEVDALRSPQRFDAALWVALLLPPGLCLVLLGAATVRRALAGGPSALQVVQAALRAEDGLEAAREAIATYLRARLELGEGEITPSDVERALRARVVEPEVIERAVTLWQALDRARFSGEGGVPTDAATVLAEVDRCLA